LKPIIKKPSKEEKEKATKWPIWEKEESSFPWQYDETETCLILEGKASVKCPDGTVEFGSGDYVIFPRGLNCTWTIKEKIKKHYNFG
jgi:uncharacterized cupin superfamily protein